MQVILNLYAQFKIKTTIQVQNIGKAQEASDEHGRSYPRTDPRGTRANQLVTRRLGHQGRRQPEHVARHRAAEADHHY